MLVRGAPGLRAILTGSPRRSAPTASGLSPPHCDNTARFWDAHSGTVFALLQGHTSGVYSAAFSPDGKRIVTASNDHTARVRDADSGKTLAFLQGPEHYPHLIIDRSTHNN